MQRHYYWLRPDVRVYIDLPDDLTVREAQRLAKAVTTFAEDPLDAFAQSVRTELDTRLTEVLAK